MADSDDTEEKDLSYEIFQIYAEASLEKFRIYSKELEEKYSNDKIDVIAAHKDSKVDNESSQNKFDRFILGSKLTNVDSHIGMFRKSTIVYIYSFLESSMVNFCNHLSSKYSYPVCLADIRGEGITRAKIYLEKLADVDFEKMNGEWSDLKNLNVVRNCIVHCNGNVALDKNTKKITQIVNNSSNLSLQMGQYIQIEREYIDRAIKQMEIFLDKLYKQVYER